MFEDVFIKIGGNADMWSKIEFICYLTIYSNLQALHFMQEFHEIRSDHQFDVHDHKFIFLVQY